MDRYTKRVSKGLAATSVVVLVGVGMSQSGPGNDPTARELYEAARDRYSQVGSYIARLTRREVVKGKQRPEELILLKFRERPWSAYMQWIGEEGRGREGVYVQGQHGDKIHTRLAAGDVPFMPAGRRMALSPTGALIRSASPRPITELGIGAAVEKVGGVLATLGDDQGHGSVSMVGPERRQEFVQPAFGIEHRLQAGVDPLLPDGGRRTYYFDPVTNLPTVILGVDKSGREMEYYRYDRLQLGVHLDDADFNPDLLWPAPPRAS